MSDTHDITWEVKDVSEGLYTGQWSNKHNRPEGYGTIIYKRTNEIYWDRHMSSYSGSWSKGKCDGCGTLYYTGGARYDGQWADGKRQGVGVMSFRPQKGSNQAVRFKGEYSHGAMKRGKLWVKTDGGEVSYEGEFSAGKEAFDDNNASVTECGVKANRIYKEGVWKNKPPAVQDTLEEILKREI